MAYSNRLMGMFGLRLPILQAPIGSIATPALLQAVGRAGGMGALAFAEMPLSTALDHIDAMNATGLPYFVNYILRFGTDTVRAVAAARPPAITLSWGLEPGLIHDIQTHGVRVGVQVGSLAGAIRALAAGADFLIAQGFEAGGHVQSSTPLDGYLGGVVALAGSVPVVAAGGIATGQDIARALGRGAQGVMIGTRYVATLESGAHPLYKQAIVDAGAGATAMTNCFDINWPYAMHRVLRNTTLEAWEAAGCPASPDRPGEGDEIATGEAGPLIRYMDAPPTHLDEGDILAGCLYAGTGVDHIAGIEAAEPLTQRLWQDASRAMETGQ